MSELDESPESPGSRGVVVALLLIIAAYGCWLGFSPRVVHSAAAEGQSTARAISAATPVIHSSDFQQDGRWVAPPPSFASTLPFIVLLGSIALLPLFGRTAHWWENNGNRFLVAGSLALLTLAFYVFAYPYGVEDHFSHSHEPSEPGFAAALVVLKNAILVEYIPFICLLFSLYVISGGIHLRGNLVGKPKLNAGLILLGGSLASLIGTTGAAMLLIRPLLRANARRRYVSHTVIFFIFVVCNTGGCLLPIGDPPLFLGYLRGVPFLWTLNLWPMWLVANLTLCAIYYAWDTYRYRIERQRIILPDEPTHPERFAIEGALNLLWLVGVILCVAFFDPSRAVPGTDWHAPIYFREVAMLTLTALSLICTAQETRRKNVFNYGAIIEVAALFVGIFICMQAPIQILKIYGPTLGFDETWKYFWGTGILSSFLDNAPTYVVFFETAASIAHPDAVTVAGVMPHQLMAISLGSVFMGAMTYIGNGPNFMVKAIAEQNNVRMPSFFGYMVYSCVFVLPVCVLVSVVFLSTH